MINPPRQLAPITLLLLALLLLAGCGQVGDEEGELPLTGDARRIDAAQITDEPPFALSDPWVSAWRSNQSFDEVVDYYENQVDDDGWTVSGNVDITDQDHTAFLSKEDKVVIVNIMTGARAKSQTGSFQAANLDLDPDAVNDDDTVLVFTHFTCEEADINACLDFARQ